MLNIKILPNPISLFFIITFIIIYQAHAEDEITSYPKYTSKSCRNGKAKLYDECSDQMQLFKQALKQANKENKILLISYGAEWCIWCHVFNSHIKGQTTKFTYTYASGAQPDLKYTSTLLEKQQKDVAASAKALKQYVSKNFVILHVDYRFAPGGANVLKTTGAINHIPPGIPYIFTVNRIGRYTAQHSHDRTAIRRDGFFDWYRGYNRDALLQELKEMYETTKVERKK